MRKRIVLSNWSPLSLARRHDPSNFAPSLAYVPGTALRGALAARYLADARLQREGAGQLETHGWNFQQYFHWLFLSGQVRFSNLHRQHPEGGGRTWTTPLSARTCKAAPGFEGDRRGRLDERHGVWDLLLTGETERTDDGCPACKGGLEPAGAERAFYQDDGAWDPRRTVSDRTRLLTRTAVESATETVRSGALYTLEAMEEGGETDHLAGTLEAEDPPEWPPESTLTPTMVLAEDLAQRIREISLGRARSRGMGQARLRLEEDHFEPPPLAERLRALNSRWRETAGGRAERVFSLTLNSDALVLDDLWRYCTALDGPLLAREYPGGPPVTPERRYTTARLVSGWNAAHRLPKEDELAIGKGAAFLFRTAADEETLLPWLERLERQWIGERRNEGFGEVIVCHPFHLRTLPEGGLK